MKKLMLILLVIAALAVLAVPAFAAKDRTKRAKAYGYDAMMEKFYHPAPWITLGADFRARYVYAPHITTLDSTPNDDSSANWHYTRWRTRLWGKFELCEDVDINARVVNEFRTWHEPDTKQKSWNGDEIFFDKLNLTFRNAFDLPLTVVVGRQDISLGHRWLVFEGTQNDGSRTIFFDAIRATYEMADWDAKLDLIYINQTAYQRNRIKPINDRALPVNYEDQQGLIVWMNKKWNEKLSTDGYFIYRKDDPVVTAVSEDSEFYTFGGIVDGWVDDNKNWQYYVESAIQTGSKDQENMEAFGLNSRVNYHTNDEWQNCFGLSYEFMTGDDPSTAKNEKFDPLWGVWPQWSELLIYTWSEEHSIAEITNMHRLGLHWSFKPAEKWSIATAYHLLWADENTFKSKSTPILFDESGDFRGQLATIWLKYNHDAHWKGHVVWEYFCPGSYYDQGNRASAMFLRLNVEYTF